MVGGSRYSSEISTELLHLKNDLGKEGCETPIV